MLATNAQTTTTPEIQLLLVCLGSAAPDADSTLQRILTAQSIDYDVLLQSILWHDVTILVLRRLRSSGCFALLPKEFAAQLQKIVTRQTARSMVQVAALGELQKAAEDAAVQFVAWKGPALAALLYDDFAVRSSCDLDLLVHRSQLSAMEAVLVARGFEADAVGQSEIVTAKFRDFYHEVKFSRKKLHIELHDEIMPKAYLGGQTMQSCLDRSTWLRLNPSVRVRTLALDDLLLSLCLHGSKHHWEKLKWLCDIASFLERYGNTMNWAQLIAQARKLSAIRPLLSGALLCHRLFGSHLPEAVHIAIAQDAGLKTLVDMQEAQLRSGQLKHEQGELLQTVCATHLLARHRERAMYVIRKLFILGPRDVARVSLPDYLGFLYYPLRWMYLGRAAGHTLIQIVVRRTSFGSMRFGRLFRKLRHLMPKQWPLLFETLCAILISSVGLKLVRLQSLHRVGHSIFKKFANSKPSAPAELHRIAETVNRVANVIPRAKCLSRALAAQWMLARRGTVGIVHVGVAKSADQSFQSHAWVTVHGTVFIGGATASHHYQEMLRLSAESYIGIPFLVRSNPRS